MSRHELPGAFLGLDDGASVSLLFPPYFDALIFLFFFSFIYLSFFLLCSDGLRTKGVVFWDGET